MLTQDLKKILQDQVHIFFVISSPFLSILVTLISFGTVKVMYF